MLKRISFVVVLSAILLLIHQGHASADTNMGNQTSVIAYQIRLGDANTGYMEIKRKNNCFESQFYHISANDRIPFFARQKKGCFANGLYATELSFNSTSYDVYNDLTNNAPANLPSFLESNKENRAALVNQANGEIVLSFDKIPMVTFENIVIGFLEGKIQEGQEMLLYEEANDIQVKIFFQKDEQFVPKGPCESERLICYRKNIPGKPPKSLFTVTLNNNGGKRVPRIIASKSRWQFEIQQIGAIQDKTISITEYLVDKARKDVNSAFAGLRDPGFENLQLSNFKTDRSGRSYEYDYQLEVKFQQPNYNLEAISYFRQNASYRRSSLPGNPNHVSQEGDSFVVSASRKEVCGYLVNKHGSCDVKQEPLRETPSINSFLTKIQNHTGQNIDLKEQSKWIPFDGSFLVDPDTGDKIMAIEEACEIYLQRKYPNKVIRNIDHEIVEDHYERKSLKIMATEEKPMPEDEIHNAAACVLSEKIWGQSKSGFGNHRCTLNSLKFYERRNSPMNYFISVDRKTLDDRIDNRRGQLISNICRNLASATSGNRPDSRTGQNQNLYKISGRGQIDRQALDQTIEENLFHNYTRLRYMNDPIQKHGEDWTFPVISADIQICR